MHAPLHNKDHLELLSRDSDPPSSHTNPFVMQYGYFRSFIAKINISIKSCKDLS